MKQLRTGQAWLYGRRSQARAYVFSAIGLALIVNVVSGDNLSAAHLRTPAVFFFIAVLVLETAIRLSRPPSVVIFGASQAALRNDFSFGALIGESSDILILGGTLKTFTDDSEALGQLREFYTRNPTGLRILMMHPDGGGVESTARARNARGRSDTVVSLQGEVYRSLARLRDEIGPSIYNCVRLYKEHPTYSMFKFGQTWLLTVYTLGRGASSPAIYFRATGDRAGFARGLVQGFEELWGASTTLPADRLLPLP